MKTFKHKHYNHEKNYMPIEHPFEEPIVIAMEAPNDNYEEYAGTEYMVDFVSGKYLLNEERGREYFRKLSGKMSVLITEGVITLAQGEEYGVLVDKVGVELRKGYYHSAYRAATAFDPQDEMGAPSPYINTVHEDVVAELRAYVLEHYPPSYHSTVQPTD